MRRNRLLLFLVTPDYWRLTQHAPGGISVCPPKSLSLMLLCFSLTHRRIHKTHTYSLSVLLPPFLLIKHGPTVHPYLHFFPLSLKKKIILFLFSNQVFANGSTWACMSALVSLYICVHVWADVRLRQSCMLVPDSSIEIWDKLEITKELCVKTYSAYKLNN